MKVEGQIEKSTVELGDLLDGSPFTDDMCKLMIALDEWRGVNEPERLVAVVTTGFVFWLKKNERVRPVKAKVVIE